MGAVLLVKKADSELRLCVDYRGLNDGTRKNRHPHPLLNNTLLRSEKARYCTRLDVCSAYNSTGVASHAILLASLLSTFRNFINDVLRPHLKKLPLRPPHPRRRAAIALGAHNAIFGCASRLATEFSQLVTAFSAKHLDRPQLTK